MEYPELIVVLTKYVSDDPQPGLTEAQVVDIDGKVWTFIDKVPIFTRNNPITYPTTGRLRCQIIEERSSRHLGRVYLVSTENPNAIQDITGSYPSFWVLADQIIKHTQNKATPITRAATDI